MTIESCENNDLGNGQNKQQNYIIAVDDFTSEKVIIIQCYYRHGNAIMYYKLSAVCFVINPN